MSSLPFGFAASPWLNTDVVFNSESTPDLVAFTLTCTSTGFPPTFVTWSRDGQVISDDNIHDIYQQLLDARTSTFDNVLRVTARQGGVYRCLVGNTGGSNFREIEIRGNASLFSRYKCSNYFSSALWEAH